MTDTAPVTLILIALTAIPVSAVAGLVWHSVLHSRPDDISPDERLLAAIMEQNHDAASNVQD